MLIFHFIAIILRFLTGQPIYIFRKIEELSVCIYLLDLYRGLIEMKIAKFEQRSQRITD